MFRTLDHLTMFFNDMDYIVLRESIGYERQLRKTWKASFVPFFFVNYWEVLLYQHLPNVLRKHKVN